MTTTTETNAPTQPLETTEEDLMAFVHRAMGDVGAVLNGAMVVIGDRLGLYRAMAGRGPITPTELAEATGTDERYVREWLSAQATAGYVSLEDDNGSACPTSRRSPSPTRPAPPASSAPSSWRWPRCRPPTGSPTPSARAPASVGRPPPRFHEGCERFFRPGYLNHLVAEWLPALDGAVKP